MKKPNTLNALLEGLYSLPRILPLLASDLSLDTRTLKENDLFFALSGTQLKGQDYIDEAMRKGACAILMEGETFKLHMENQCTLIELPQLHQHLGTLASRFYGAPEKSLDLIAITGTNGKTSCSHFIANALHKHGVPCGLIGTLGAGLFGNLTPLNNTTPDIFTLYKTLAFFRDQGAKAVAMEVSSHALKQQRVQGLPFKLAIFTNLTQDHLDYHLTFEDYAASKRLLFDAYEVKHAIINIDDPIGQTWSTQLPHVETYTYGTQGQASVLAHHVTFSPQGIKAAVKTPWGDGMITSHLLGNFNISNLLATLTALGLYDIPLSTSLQLLNTIPPVPGRMERIGGEKQPTVIIDYAHTPDALEKALKTLRPYCQGEIWCLFGCGGNRDSSKRPLMGAIAEKYADNVILTDDNPRHESSRTIIDEILKGFHQATRVIIEPNRRHAIQHAIACAQAEDIILIAGKGHESYQIIGDQKHIFSDTIEAKLALENRIEKL